MIYAFKILMKGSTYEIVNANSQVNWSVVSNFFLKEMREKKLLCVVIEKHKV